MKPRLPRDSSGPVVEAHRRVIPWLSLRLLAGFLTMALAGMAAPTAGQAEATFAGQSVIDVITALESDGVVVYYSSDLIQPGMQVDQEPGAGTEKPEALLNEILAPFGLTTRPGPGDSLLIIRQPEAGRKQPGAILGVVRERHTARRIVGAEVLVDGAAAPVVTSASGQFHLIGLAPGTHTLSVDPGGHGQPAVVDVTVRAGETRVLELEVENPEIESLSRVVVSASRFDVAGSRSASFRYLPVEQIEQLPDFGDDPLRSVARLPGTATNGFSAKSNLRGGETDETLVMFDGLRLRSPFHLKDYQSVFSAIDPAIISGLDVYTGGLPAELGDRMSGAVSISPVETPAAPYHEFTQTLFNSSALSAGTLDDGRIDWVASARRGNLDLLLDIADPDLGDPSYMDFYGRFGVQATDTLRVTGNALVFVDDIRLTDNDDEELAEGSGEDHYLWLRLDHDLAEGLTGRTLISHTYLDSNREGRVKQEGVSNGSLKDERSFTINTLQSQWSWWASDRTQVLVGGEISRMDGNYDYLDEVEFDLLFLTPGTPSTPERSREFHINPDGEQYAGYANARIGITQQLVADLSLRWDMETLTDNEHAMWSPRIGAIYKLGDRTSLRAHWGRHFQVQGIDELQINDGITEYFRPQRADHVVLGLDHRLPADIDLRVEVYQKDMDRLRPRFENILNSRVLLPELRPDRIGLDPGEAQARGVELSLARDRGNNLSWWFSYAWSEVKDDFEGEHVRRSWDQTHAVKGGLAWRRGPWQASLAATWNTGWPTTDAALVTETPLPLVQTGPRNDERLGEFFSLDARLAREWQLKRSTLTGFVEVSNLTNRFNECCADYDYEDGEDGEPAGLDLDPDNYLRLFPSLGVVWRFGDAGTGRPGSAY